MYRNVYRQIHGYIDMCVAINTERKRERKKRKRKKKIDLKITLHGFQSMIFEFPSKR